MSEEIRKSFSGGPMKADAVADIDLINRYTLKELKPEEVFAFNINLCDDQPDRDDERFSLQSLRRLASLFPGKPLIQDHEWSANNQQGRVYRAQVVQDGNVNRLRASIYMLRTSGTKETIAQIEGGVLKEVSVGVKCKRMTCSVCGKPMLRSWGRYAKCENDHEKGMDYNGQICLGILEDPSEAYEVSFVAVPAQREAGVTKGRHTGKNALSPEEWAYRKRILEKSEGFTIPDAAWEAIIQGKATSAEVVAALRKQAKHEETAKHYPDIVPNDNGCIDDIKYALIPDNVIPKDVMADVWKALGFCRKELNSPPISVRWFSPVSFARHLGLDTAKLKTFEHKKDLMGIASRQNPTQILLRYPIENGYVQELRMKTVFHECWHTLQFRDDCNPAEEDSAYTYEEDAYKRFCSLSAGEKEDLYYGELLMKDYSQK